MFKPISLIGQFLLIAVAVAITWAVATTQPSSAQPGSSRPTFESPSQDTDGDGVPNIDDSDDDNDGLTDKYEKQIGTNPLVADSDGDGLTDAEEIIGAGFDPETGRPITTDPNNDDSDNDGWTDGAERKHGSDPHDRRSTPNAPGGQPTDQPPYEPSN